MQSKNKKSPTVAEAEYIRLVAVQPCSVCDQGGGEAAPSEVHEIEQGNWWGGEAAPSEVHESEQGNWGLSIALCAGCHRGAFNGLHGQMRMWKLKKLDEQGALAITIRRVFTSAPSLARARAHLESR